MSQAARAECFDPTIPMPTPEPVVEEVGSAGMLLKSPQSFARLVAQDHFDLRASLVLLATAFGFCALYGLATGFFAGGNSLWQAAIKTPLILMGSVALCAPSLYVLVGLSGTHLNVRQTTALVAGVTCLTSLLMVGFAPVTWLFGVSTSNVQFMVLLHLLVWGAGLGCGLRLLGIAVPGGLRENKTLLAWAGIFLFVCAQMLTHFRPVLGVALHGRFREPEKRFFFQHFSASMSGQPRDAAPEPAAPLAPPVPLPDSDLLPPPSAVPVSN
jgi:hypothetical protein